jgi:PAS domain S-box-containing protein
VFLNFLKFFKEIYLKVQKIGKNQRVENTFTLIHLHKNKAITKLNMENKSLRILFAEDLLADVEMAIREIRKGGINFIYRVTDTENEFRKELLAFNPDIVISDYTMPTFDGMQALRITRSGERFIPFIILTGSTNEEIAVACLKSGADDYVIKEQIKRLSFAVLDAIEKEKAKSEKRRIQEKLRESEEMYRSLIENSSDAVYLIKDRKFEMVNNEFERMFGYSFEEVSHPEFSFMQLVAPESRYIIEERHNRIDIGGKAANKYQFTALTKNGKKLEVEASVSYTDIKHKDIKQGIIRDITTQKRVENQLRESESKFRNLFQNHTAVKLIINPENGCILEANNAAADFYGWTVEKLQKMKISDINILPDIEIQKEIEKVRNSQNVYFEFRHLKADGSIVDVEAFTSKVSFNGSEVLHTIIHDVSARKKTEQRLHLLNHAVEQNPVSIVITNPEGIIEYANPGFTAMTGYSMEEVKDTTLRILKSGFQTEEFYRNFWDTINAGKDWSGEFKNKKKDGAVYWQETAISPILNEDGIITHFVAVMEDITEKKRMIQDLVRAKEKAEESDRLKSAFLANMSHEIRTPMNGIIGFTDLLREQKLNGAEKSKYINIIKKSGERMLNTINDLIEISKIESGSTELEFSEININHQMDFFHHFFMPEANRKGLQLYCHKSLPSTHSLIETDNEKLNTIFSNLIKNAIKYTVRGQIDIGYTITGNTIEFYVKDTGIGIEEKRHHIIFDRFVQADMSLSKPYEGAGLGLSIAKAYVGMLGGKIWLKSTPGKGSQFFFTIPCKLKLLFSEEKLHAPRKNNDKDVLSDLTVLVAGDDDIGKLYLSELLNGKCKKIIFASNGIEALELFKSTPEIDVVLMDIKMPGMNGYETSQKMKEINRKVFIIAQTAHALSGDKERALASGCDYYLSKPFSKSQLLEVVSKYY